MAAFTVDPNNPDLVVSDTGRVLPRSAVSPADIQAPAPAAAPAQPAKTAAELLARRDAVLGPLEVSSRTTNTQKGLASSVLDPVLQSNTAATEKLATATEEAGKAKTERELRRTEVDATSAYGRYSTSEAERQQAQQRAEIARQSQLAISAQQDPEVDPDRYVKNMSTGKSIALTILAAINGAFGSITGQGNQVLQILQSRIDQDIDAQKQAITDGKVRRGNLIQYFKDQGLKEEAAEQAAKATSIAMLERLATISAEREKAPEAAENAKLLAAQLRAQTEQANNQLKLTLGTDRQTTSVTQERPKPAAGSSPSDILAMLKIGDALIEKSNADEVAKIVGHQVSADEAKKIKVDAQDYSQRRANNATTQQAVMALATKIGLTRGADGKWQATKEMDPGKRPLGVDALSNEQARDVDRLWSQLKEAKIMTMAREPANSLQKEFGDAVDRPFWDDEIPNVLNMIEARVQAADENLRAGYPEASKFYNKSTPQPDSGYVPGKATPR